MDKLITEDLIGYTKLVLLKSYKGTELIEYDFNQFLETSYKTCKCIQENLKKTKMIYNTLKKCNMVFSFMMIERFKQPDYIDALLLCFYIIVRRYEHEQVIQDIFENKNDFKDEDYVRFNNSLKDIHNLKKHVEKLYEIRQVN